jgi:hypothetical protein
MTTVSCWLTAELVSSFIAHNRCCSSLLAICAAGGRGHALQNIRMKEHKRDGESQFVSEHAARLPLQLLALAEFA